MQKVEDSTLSILQSPLFHSKSIEEKQEILNSILATGEICQQKSSKLINDRTKIQNPLNIETLDYPNFMNLVLRGGIKGKDLIRFCHTSVAINNICNKEFKLNNGEIQNQYLFRLLLNKMNITVPPNKTPRQVYIEKTIGGKVWGFGRNALGQLGLRNYNNVTVPTLIPNLNGIIKISCGVQHTLALNNRGRVWGFGDGSRGQLNISSKYTVKSPELIPDLENIVEVSAGSDYSLALDDRGRVWGLGEFYNIPILIPNLENIIKIKAKYNHSLCLDNKGRVWGFGYGVYGKLGLGELNLDGKIVTPTLIPNLENIVEIASGVNHSLVLDSQGRVWGFGYNGHGQLGLNDDEHTTTPTLVPNLDNVIAIACGSDHSLVLDNKGRVWGFGYNFHGQLGLGDKIERLTPTLIPNLENIVEIACDADHSLVLDNQGRAWSFGYNKYGELGLNDDEHRTTPTLVPNLDSVIAIACGQRHSLVIRM